MTLIHIVPSLPPPFEGVSGFAGSLAEALEEITGIESRLVAADARARTTGDLARALAGRTDRVLLHYSGYGYSRRGCPIWLAAGLESWRRGRPDRRLISVFHEIYATGPPWRSSFWLHPVQRRIAARLARLSDGVVTSLSLYGDLLRRLGARTEPRVLPVFSGVGQPTSVPVLVERRRRLAVFGGAGTRARAYRKFRSDLTAACRALQVEEVVDLGPPYEEVPARVAGVPVHRLGPLPAEEVSAVLLDSIAGFLAYPAAFLPKSTIFAAYCAHGVVPIHAWRRDHRRFPREPSLAWLPAEGAIPASTGELEDLANRARSWYGGHDLETHARLYRSLLETPP